MIELRADELVFAFPEVHPGAQATVNFQRTLRIPDDGKDYPLPPGLGRFPLRHVDDFGRAVPPSWIEHGGVLLPMYQAEALWLSFQGNYLDEHEAYYRIALKIATGKINAVSGQPWRAGLHRRPQDYVVVPEQPWLDGYCVEKGIIRQFVAMPLGAGYTAEEQVTGKAEFGGLQIMAIPMKRDVFERHFPKVPTRPIVREPRSSVICFSAGGSEMGLAPGGRMRQEISEDPFDLADWDLEHASRCFIHICNSKDWQAITGEQPPTEPPTAAAYTKAGMPWFDYYSEREAVAGSKVLAGLQSVATLGRRRRKKPLPENETVKVDRVINLRPVQLKGRVREYIC